MQIRYGFDIHITLLQPSVIVTLLDIRPETPGANQAQSQIDVWPRLPMEKFIDAQGNVSRRITAPPGRLTLSLDEVITVSGDADRYDPNAELVPIEYLPANTLQYLNPSRYCESDMLASVAWPKFGHILGGHERVQAICDFVNGHLTFGYPNARATRTAFDALNEGVGVCRDFAHLAIALCRAVNIPARYCNGYLGDIGVPADPAPMDFNAWFEAYIGGAWVLFDARHNTPRIGRIPISCGRDASEAAMFTTYGPHSLDKFEVITEEVTPVPVRRYA